MSPENRNLIAAMSLSMAILIDIPTGGQTGMEVTMVTMSMVSLMAKEFGKEKMEADMKAPGKKVGGKG